MASNYPPAGYAGAPAPKKKTSPIVWVLLVIGVIVLLFVLAIAGIGFFFVYKAKQAGIDPGLWQRNPSLAAAKMIAATNPDAEVVRADEGKGIVVIRQKSTGKTFTMNFEDIKKGRITFSDDEGATATVGGGAENLPAWVPVYSGVKPEVAVAGQSGEGAGGTFAFTTRDSVAAVADFYKSALEREGFTVNTESEAGLNIMTAVDESGGRKVSVSITGGGETRAQVVYSTEK